jgi:hypothetical protein
MTKNESAQVRRELTVSDVDAEEITELPPREALSFFDPGSKLGGVSWFGLPTHRVPPVMTSPVD